MRKAGKAETDLTRQVREAVEALGVYVERLQAGGYRGRARGAKKGSPDLIGRLKPRGRMFAIETKNTHRDGCPCEHCTAQRVWRAEHERDGGLYLQARTVEVAFSVVAGWINEEYRRGAA